MGYEIQGDRFEEVGIPHRFMEKQLIAQRASSENKLYTNTTSHQITFGQTVKSTKSSII